MSFLPQKIARCSSLFNKTILYMEQYCLMWISRQKILSKTGTFAKRTDSKNACFCPFFTKFQNKIPKITSNIYDCAVPPRGILIKYQSVTTDVAAHSISPTDNWDSQMIFSFHDLNHRQSAKLHRNVMSFENFASF